MICADQWLIVHIYLYMWVDGFLWQISAKTDKSNDRPERIVLPIPAQIAHDVPAIDHLPLGLLGLG